MRKIVACKRASWLCLFLLLPRLAVACGLLAGSAPQIMAAADEPDGARITFLGHASFLIESPERVTVVTDYNGVNIPSQPPEIATMNHAHATHYTDDPDPRIRYVLHGWNDDGTPARIALTVRDMHVRNIPTRIRNYMTGSEELYGNSIFIFETAGLCIAHLSHLHHALTREDLDVMGPIDVVMAPVDGVWTMNQQDMLDVLAQIHAPVVIPMHYFGPDVLERFIELARAQYEIVRNPGPTVMLSAATGPQRPTVLVLSGY